MPYRIIFPGLLALFAFFSGAVAAKPLLYEPVIYEGNGNVYMLFDTKFRPDGTYVGNPGIPWGTAAELAKNTKYEGVAGRLAIIDSATLDMFIRTNLRPSKLAWIGMRYICSQKHWVYSNGENVPVTAYTNWHPTNWGANVMGNTLNCGSLYSFFGAFLMSNESGGSYWALNTNVKFYVQFVVEFPLGEINTANEAADESSQ